MGTINLDAKRRARLEAKGEGPQVVWGGKTFKFAPELPYEALEVLGDNAEPDSPAPRSRSSGRCSARTTTVSGLRIPRPRTSASWSPGSSRSTGS